MNLQEMAIEKMKKGFGGLLETHITDMMKRSREFTDEGLKFTTTFKFDLDNTGKKMEIDLKIAYPGAGVKDSIETEVIDLEQPNLPGVAKKTKKE